MGSSDEAWCCLANGHAYQLDKIYADTLMYLWQAPEYSCSPAPHQGGQAYP